MECNQSRPGFELVSPCSFPMTITTTPRAPPKIWRCPWCYGYRRRKWIRQHEFKSWTRLITFHIVLIPLGKVWIKLYSLQLWVNSRTDCFFSLGEATSLGEGKLWIPTPLKNWSCVISCQSGGDGKYNKIINTVCYIDIFCYKHTSTKSSTSASTHTHIRIHTNKHI